MGQSHHALNPTCSPLYTGSLECHTTCSVLAFTMAAPAPAQPPRSPTARCCQADVRACAGRGAPQAAFKLGGRPLSRSGAPALLPRGVAAMLDKALGCMGAPQTHAANENLPRRQQLALRLTLASWQTA